MKIKAISFFAVIFTTLILTLSCSGEEPGPISVRVTVTPVVVDNGDNARCEIEVTNMGGDVEIDRLHVREEIISGTYAGEYTEEDLPVSNPIVDAHESAIIYSIEHALYNFTDEDVQSRITATVYSDGGTASDNCTYTIKSAYSGSSQPSGVKAFIIHTGKLKK